MINITTLILACSMSSSPQINDLMYRIITAHSGGHAYFITNSSTGLSYRPETPQLALAMATGLAQSGHQIELGLTGLPQSTMERWKLSPAQAFEACPHIKVASLELEELIERADFRNEDRLHKKLAAFHQPDSPQSAQAIDWGAKVLAIEPISLEQEDSARPGGQYTLYRSPFGKGGQILQTEPPKQTTLFFKHAQASPPEPTAKASKSAQKSAQEVKASDAPKKAKTKEESQPLKPEDLTPWPQEGPQRPVTDARL